MRPAAIVLARPLDSYPPLRPVRDELADAVRCEWCGGWVRERTQLAQWLHQQTPEHAAMQQAVGL